MIKEKSNNRSETGKLDAEQLRLLAFGAPMLVYNDEKVDSLVGVMKMLKPSNTHLGIGGTSQTGRAHWVLSNGCWRMMNHRGNSQVLVQNKEQT